MTLKTSADVQQRLLGVLERVLDEERPFDLMRQRAACETVQTMINLHRLEIAYAEMMEEKQVIPFLEDARQDALQKRAASRKKRGLLAGPAPDHPWRDLGSRGKT